MLRVGFFCACCLLPVCAFAQTTLVADNKSVRETASFQEGMLTWVAYSSPVLQQAYEKLETYHAMGYHGEILSATAKNKTHYRVIFGRYADRTHALMGKSEWDSFLPADAWLLELAPDFEVLPFVERTTSPTAPRPDEYAAQPTGLLPENAEDEPTSGNASGDILDEAGTSTDELERNASEPASKTSLGAQIGTYVDASMFFSSIYEDNIDHDAASEALPSYGMVPALRVRFQSSASDPLFSFQYLVARHSYSNTDRWDRVSNAFKGVFEPRLGETFFAETSVELSLKGSSEDRDISNQFQVAQEFEYRLTNRHRLQLYGTYRIKRFPDQPDNETFKPNVGINFERTNSDGERFESGARYEFNKRQEARSKYKRWTFTVGYRTPAMNKDRDQFEVELKHRRKFYLERFVEIEDEDFLREDYRLGIKATWVHHFKGGVTMEAGYDFETRNSNDPDKPYDANALSLVMIYDL